MDSIMHLVSKLEPVLACGSRNMHTNVQKNQNYTGTTVHKQEFIQQFPEEPLVFLQGIETENRAP